MEVPKITSPSRSPNRKLRDATDRVGDRLRAYANKFKETKEKVGVKQESKRSASAGRSDTIQEESQEDIAREAERVLINRTQSLVSRNPRDHQLVTRIPRRPSHQPPNDEKPILRKGKSACTLSRDVDMGGKDSEDGKHEMWEGLQEAEGGKDGSLPQTLPQALLVTSRAVDCLTRKWDSISDEEADDKTEPGDLNKAFDPYNTAVNLGTGDPSEPTPPVNKSDSPDYLPGPESIFSDISNIFTESGWPDTANDVGSMGNVEVESNSLENLDNLDVVELRCQDYMKVGESAASLDTHTSERSSNQVSPGGRISKHTRRSGHGSRQGSKKKRKKDHEKGTHAGCIKQENTGNRRKLKHPIRSASLSSLETDSAGDSRPNRTHLSLSPCPSHSEGGSARKLLGSSTLPRSAYQQRKYAGEIKVGNSPPSVLSLQLEGAYGKEGVCTCSSYSREDTLSPHTSRSTGLVGESTETLTNLDDSILEPNRLRNGSVGVLLEPDEGREKPELLFPSLMKIGRDRIRLAAARSATLEEETDSQDQEETVQFLETSYASVYEGGVLNEIKIAEVVEIQGQQEEESQGFQLQVEEGPSTADLVDVGCDAEVAQLTCRDRDMQAYTPNIYTDWRAKGTAAGRDIKLVVQDCDSDLPDLEWEDPSSPWTEASGQNPSSLWTGVGQAQDPSWTGAGEVPPSTWTVAGIEPPISTWAGVGQNSATPWTGAGQGSSSPWTGTGEDPSTRWACTRQEPSSLWTGDGQQDPCSWGQSAHHVNQEEYQLNSQKHWQEQWNRSDQHNPVWSGVAPLQDPGGEWLGVNQQQLGNWQTPNQLEPGSQQWQPIGEGSSSPGWVHSTPQSHTHQNATSSWLATQLMAQGKLSPWGGGGVGEGSITSASSPQLWPASNQQKNSWPNRGSWPGGKFQLERMSSKDTDSTCSFTPSIPDQAEEPRCDVTIRLPVEIWRDFGASPSNMNSEMWQKMAVQTVADKLSSEIWQEMSVQSPENTIYSASTTQKKKGRKNIMDMEWVAGDKQDIKPEREVKQFAKAATFPRLSGKSGGEMKEFYRSDREQFNDFNLDYETFRISGAEDTDQEDDETTRTIQEAIQHQAAKKREKGFNNNNQSNEKNTGFKLPAGFVTPVRDPPHRNIKSEHQRHSRLPASRRPLRGPFGEMLMEEMAKSSNLKSKSSVALLSKSSPPAPLSNPPPTTSLSTAKPPILSIPPPPTSSHQDDDILNRGVVTSGLVLPSTIASTISSLSSLVLSPTISTLTSAQAKHQRTRSSPCRIDYEKLDQSSAVHHQFLTATPAHPDNFMAATPDEPVNRFLTTAPVPPAHPANIFLTAAPDASAHPANRFLTAVPDASANPAINRTEKGSSAFRIIKDTRALVVREVFQVEKSYVESLQFLIIKYMQPLKNPANAFSIESNLVDDIFFQIPSILLHHETFLDDLRRRIENWETKQTIGDWFLESFSTESVLEAYTGFIRNVKRADHAIRVARSIKPAFDRFLQEMRRERKGERLSLTDLLAKPHQRIPRYRLLIQRLLEHTEPEHEDYVLLQRAERDIHDLALNISTVEKEATEQEVRQGILRQLELLVHGLGPGDLASTTRTLIRQDLVSSSTTTWIRKERCIFLLSDLVVITTVSRRGTRSTKEGKKSVAGTSSGNLNQNILETCRHKLWMFLSLNDVEIGVDEGQRRTMKESGDIEEDIKLLHSISEQSARLNCPHREIDDGIKNTLNNLNKQLLERQALDPTGSHGSSLQLSIHTADGPETLNLAFESLECKAEWENQLNKCKARLEESLDPPPNLLTLIPIRKTRAGLQFTCASPTLGLNSHGLKDVWVCNSDGYVGQVCVLSLRPEPTVICCNGVCNARILSIVSVPSDCPAEPGQWNRNTHLRKEWPSWSAPSTPAGLGWVTPPSHAEWSSKSWTVNSEGGTAESSPQSGGVGPILDISSEEEADGEEELIRNSQYIRQEQAPATMWLGTEDGTIHVYNCSDNIRIKKNKEKFTHSSPVLSILYHSTRVYAALGSGEVYIYSRDSSGVWDKVGCIVKVVGTPGHPVTRMCIVEGNVWCSTHNRIRRLDLESNSVEDITTLHDNRSIVCMEVSGLGLWIVQENSAAVHLFHTKSRVFLLELNVISSVTKLLSSCDEIIRQHKTACLRVTCLLPVKDTLWVGTSAGVIVTAVIPAITETTTKLHATPPLTGINHGHTGHVRFLTSVQIGGDRGGVLLRKNSMAVDGVLRRKTSSANNSNDRKDEKGGVGGSVMVISGGDGFEDFSANSTNDLAGREDSTNHLLLWSV